MKMVDIDEFSDHILEYLLGDETVAVEQNGRPLGYYVPAARGRRDDYREAMDRLDRIVREVQAATGMTEDELVDIFDLSKPAPENLPEIAGTGASRG